MKDPIEGVQEIGRRLETLKSSDEELYQAVRTLEPETAETLRDANEKRALAVRPVNLLRYEILRRVLNGEEVGAHVTEQIQEAIQSRDASAFGSAAYPDDFAERLRTADLKKNIFQNWRVQFRVCYPFFFAGDDRRHVPQLLDTVAKKIKEELDLESHDHRCFTFDGPNNFGDTSCWLAVFPRERGSHTNAFQLYLGINPHNLEYGLHRGKNVRSNESFRLERGTRIEDVTGHFRIHRRRYLVLNEGLIATWKFAPGPNASYWEDFHREGIISISFDGIVGDLRQYTDSIDLADRLGVEDPNNSNVVWNLESFRDAGIGDIVVANRGQRTAVGVGVIEGPYEYRADRNEYWHVRKARWLISTELKFNKPMFRLDTFSPTLKWQDIKKRLLEEHPGLHDELEKIENRPESDRSITTPANLYTHEQALADSGLTEDTFAEHWAVLQDKRQVVLQGPPGTGKTYLAEIYGRLVVAGDIQRLEVVQFHPSYSYEDFVEGYRPTTGGGLEVREGVFKLICGKARESGDPTVLIIDEINRGDLSKIFGELLYLLEYRGKQIKLTHNPRLSFEIPKNLYLIGTMNTADRSLALIDYALRRRFSFISLEPQYDLVKRLVTSSEIDLDVLIKNFVQLNREISANTALGSDFQIGHSYLLRHRELTRVKLAQVWRFDIEALLREYYFDAQEQLPRLHDLFFDGLAGA